MARRPPPLPAAGATTGLRHALELVRGSVPPLHPAGRPFVAGSLALGLLGRRSRVLRRTGTTAALACAAFFREPARTPPSRPGVVVAPADGVVTIVDTAVPPAELGLPAVAVPRVCVFLSLLDAHVQRSPVSAAVVAVVHTPGRFLSADLPAASSENERTAVHLRTPDGVDVAVVQIAGLLARRIVCDLRPGGTTTRGATYGLIRFGSRVDTYLPAGSRLLVEPGQRTVGAETVLAELP